MSHRRQVRDVNTAVQVSALICTHNRALLLNRSLAALIDGTETKPDQVIVVNGGGADADTVIDSFAGRAGVEVVRINTRNKNLAASRNAGLPHCTGDIIAMTDDDAEVFPDWIRQIKRAHTEHPEAGAVGGPVISAGRETLLSRIADLVTFPRPAAPGPVRTLPGVNLAYKRAVVDRLGPQDERLFRGEDVDYNWRVKQLGFTIYYDPAIRVRHHHRPTLRGFLQQHYMYGRAYVLVRRKWPEMYCVYPHEFRRPRDFARAINFAAAALYEPLLIARRLPRLADRLGALPILWANEVAWRGGMIVQRFHDEPDGPMRRPDPERQVA